MVIAREGRPDGPNPSQLFHILSRSTYGRKVSSKLVGHLERFPRKYICKYVNKGSDQTMFGLERDGTTNDVDNINGKHNVQRNV